MAKGEFTFTRDDVQFLKENGIRPTPPTPQEELVSAIRQHSLIRPSTVIIPASVARDIIQQYGELNLDTFWAYQTSRSINESDNGKRANG